ncbi:hypothetical protein H6G95_36370 [Nostoc linckia FACHB-391]|uniref:Transposase n=1 Tax=Nostoc linckia FACHB-391 TaxID=2692906 RepID=A0ABR8F6W1_NOSLI|nr:hypothetical protein [Nostoc linckia]MBD2565933.1 hypothetical protein [Nostoc linckia FACHB-391]
MDVELQVLKHLARDANPTVAIIDEYPSSKKQKCFFTSIGNAIAFLGRLCHYRGSIIMYKA